MSAETAHAVLASPHNNSFFSRKRPAGVTKNETSLQSPGDDGQHFPRSRPTILMPWVTGGKNGCQGETNVVLGGAYPPRTSCLEGLTLQKCRNVFGQINREKIGLGNQHWDWQGPPFSECASAKRQVPEG